MASFEVGDILTADALNATVDLPLCRLVQQTAQSLTDNTDTALTFGSGSEVVDTHGMHDESTNNTRVTPNVAGWYEVTATLIMTARTDYNTIVATVARNGTVQSTRDRTGPNAVSSARTASATGTYEANGTTDYFEAYGLQDNVANAAVLTNQGGSFSCTLEVKFVRPL